MSEIGNISEKLHYVKKRIDLYTSQTNTAAEMAKSMTVHFGELLHGSNTGSLQFIQNHLQEANKNLKQVIMLLQLSSDTINKWITEHGGVSGIQSDGNTHFDGLGPAAGITDIYNAETNNVSSDNISGFVSGGKGITSVSYLTMTSDLKESNVDYHVIHAVNKECTREEIIQKLGGGDQTKGSCSSLALAYAGNVAGYEVLDFRDGESRKYFADIKTIEKIASLSGVDSISFSEINDVDCAHKLVNCMIPGKEYYFCVGRHAAIIRNFGERTEYLELQHPFQNGWHELNDVELRERFKCESHIFYKRSGFLIEVASLSKSNEFLDLLGYINTDEYAQVKGINGYVK